MADIRSFFASAGFARSKGKAAVADAASGGAGAGCSEPPGKTVGESATPSTPPVSAELAAQKKRTDSTQLRSSPAKQRQDGGKGCGREGGRKTAEGKDPRAQNKSRARQQLDSSSSSSGEASDAELRSSSSSGGEDMGRSAETARVAKGMHPRRDASNKRLRRPLLDSSSEEEEGDAGDSQRGAPRRSLEAKPDAEAETHACVIDSSEEDEGEEAPLKAKSGGKKGAPRVTLDFFLKKKTPSAAVSKGAEDNPPQRLPSTQRETIDVDAFFAAAAAKELRRKKLSPKDSNANGGGEAPVPSEKGTAPCEESGIGEKGQPQISASPSLPSSKPQVKEKTSQKEEEKADAKQARGLKRGDPSSPSSVSKKKRKAAGPPGGAAAEAGGSLSGKKFVFTGVLERSSREDAVDRVLAAGGSVTSAVSGRTDFLVVGSVLEDGRPVESGAKFRKASDLKEKGGAIRIIDEAAFEALLPTGGAVTKAETPVVRATPTLKEDATPRSSSFLGVASKGASSTRQEEQTRPLLSGTSADSLWIERHRPRSPEDLLGNREIFRTLMEWLRDWREPTLDLNARACLLSGPPGVGKTSAATLAARLAGLQLLEFNASDARSKAHIEELTDLCTGGATVEFFRTKTKTQLQMKTPGASQPLATTAVAQRQTGGRFPCLLLEEVDGLSGGDRGGSQAILRLIEKTRIPIICTCNDRMNSKVRTLASRCLDLRFEKPHASVVRQRLERIASLEGVPATSQQLEGIVNVSGGDLRQAVGHLQMLNTALRQRQDPRGLCGGKDPQVMMGAFDSAKTLLSCSSSSPKMKMAEALDCFFVDYDMVPLLVQENYLEAIRQGTQRAGTKTDVAEMRGLEAAAAASSSLCRVDEATNLLRRLQDWSLLPTVGTFCALDVPGRVREPAPLSERALLNSSFLSAAVLPSPARDSPLSAEAEAAMEMEMEMCAGAPRGRLSAKSQLSHVACQKQSKNKRLFAELVLRLLKLPSSGGGVRALKLSGYLDALYCSSLAPLLRGEDPKKCVEALEAYGLRREHLVDHLASLRLKTQARLYESVDSKTKAALTRCFNALHPPQEENRRVKNATPKALPSLKAAARGEEEGGEADEEEEESEGEDSQSLQSQSRASQRKNALSARRGGGGARKPSATPTPTSTASSTTARGRRPRGGGQKRSSKTA